MNIPAVIALPLRGVFVVGVVVYVGLAIVWMTIWSAWMWFIAAVRD